MAKAWKQYVKEMALKFGYFAIWEPGVPLKVGDIGVIRKNRFSHIANLSDLKIDFKIRPGTSSNNISHASEGKVQITFKAGGSPALPNSVLKDTQAGVTIVFNSKHATVFEAVGCKSSLLQDQVALGNNILDLYARGNWNKDWVIITELISADSGMVLISATKDAKIELSAKTTISVASFNLGDASLGLNIEFLSNMNTRIIAGPNQGLTPLFKAGGIIGRQAVMASAASRGLVGIDLQAPSEGTSDLYFGNVNYDPKAFELDDMGSVGE